MKLNKLLTEQTNIKYGMVFRTTGFSRLLESEDFDEIEILDDIVQYVTYLLYEFNGYVEEEEDLKSIMKGKTIHSYNAMISHRLYDDFIEHTFHRSNWSEKELHDVAYLDVVPKNFKPTLTSNKYGYTLENSAGDIDASEFHDIDMYFNKNDYEKEIVSAFEDITGETVEFASIEDHPDYDNFCEHFLHYSTF